ncbi:hypothetical protein ACYULU_12270, partial [Breznakiellaceae bacterium SP9]
QATSLSAPVNGNGQQALALAAQGKRLTQKATTSYDTLPLSFNKDMKKSLTTKNTKNTKEERKSLTQSFAELYAEFR